MFTIKYVYFALAAAQQAGSESMIYDRLERIDGPFDSVSKAFDESQRTVVTAHRDGGAPSMTYTFVDPDAPSPHSRHPRPTLYVMNAQGATIAKYDL